MSASEWEQESIAFRKAQIWDCRQQAKQNQQTKSVGNQNTNAQRLIINIY